LSCQSRIAWKKQRKVESVSKTSSSVSKAAMEGLVKKVFKVLSDEAFGALAAPNLYISYIHYSTIAGKL